MLAIDGGSLLTIPGFTVYLLLRGPDSAFVVGNTATSLTMFRLNTGSPPAVTSNPGFTDGGIQLGPTKGGPYPVSGGITSKGLLVLVLDDGPAQRFDARRFILDGGLDPTFGDGGIIGFEAAFGVGMGIDEADRVLVINYRDPMLLLERRRATGEIDVGFGDAGVLAVSGVSCASGRVLTDVDGMLLAHCETLGFNTRVYRIWP